jgi:hypothetical protein
VTEIVERDLDFLPPPPRELSGDYYVPMMRVCLLQLEMVLFALREEWQDKARQAWVSGTGVPLPRAALAPRLTWCGTGKRADLDHLPS